MELTVLPTFPEGGGIVSVVGGSIDFVSLLFMHTGEGGRGRGRGVLARWFAQVARPFTTPLFRDGTPFLPQIETFPSI